MDKGSPSRRKKNKHFSPGKSVVFKMMYSRKLGDVFSQALHIIVLPTHESPEPSKPS